MKWMITHSRKMDTHLKKSLVTSYRLLRKFPCFLQSVVQPIHAHLTKVPIIVEFEEELGSDLLDSLQKHMGSHRFTVKHQHSFIRSLSANVSLAGLQTLCQHERVKSIYLDREVHTCLDISIPSIGSAAAHQAGVTGKGVTIAIVDTGIYPHADLKGRIIGFKDFVKNKTAAYDDNGHGTHVAGCAAGNGQQSAGKYIGSAPEANLVGVKVLSKTGSGQLSTVIAGIKWCIDNKSKYGIRVLSMSLGSTASVSDQNDPVCQAVEKAWNSGIVVVVAAGNEGPNRSTISSPGISPSVITVGAVDTHRTIPQSDDTIADFSSRGPTIDGLSKPDIVSPGVGITSLRAPGSYLDKTDASARVGTSYFTLSGTSMATPIVSGTVAQILQINYFLTPDQVKVLLKAHAVNLGYNVYDQGSGEVNVEFLASSS